MVCINMEVQKRARAGHLARLEKELTAFHRAQQPVLVLNYCNLREFPDILLCDEHCRKKLRKLYLKRNLIGSLVCHM